MSGESLINLNPNAHVERRLDYNENDTRRINRLILLSMKLQGEDLPAEDRATTVAEMTEVLEVLHHNLSKADAMAGMYDEEAESFQQLRQSLEARIKQVAADTEQARVDLAGAQQLLRYKQGLSEHALPQKRSSAPAHRVAAAFAEYDLRARAVDELPSRASTEEQIQRVEAELVNLSTIKSKYETKLAERQRQFALLLRTVQDLKTGLQDDDPVEPSPPSGPTVFEETTNDDVGTNVDMG
ncbi:uncharacterized protein MONBRDRAFT_32129 [Monosiga brevicollis MX1]|uniref:THO complex subunit 7 homolog n=1 Tax=Monosiga brevicollis TaxID=81824 RepID=A9UXU1_MONBE|nr:uncharacterized protein MONBRDRAFT_32129 [Monosiga brevicollis MX1]EDQ89745.1 predicted protein [Monosiga brevicollis MX1]|eukprot:XP_001745167.1 hypothetical protein [Monosiga brevicollis MX1]